MADGDVLKIVAGHQVFGAPSGGGGLDITDGTTTVAAATTMHVDNATVSDSGGGTALVVPLATLDWDGAHLKQHDASAHSDAELYLSNLANGYGDNVTLQSGDAADGFAGGAASLYGGAGGASRGAGGANVSYGGGLGNGAGGDVYAAAGDAESGSDQQGGDFWFQLGRGDGAGRVGYLRLATFGGHLPTSDPLVAGVIFTDGAAGPGAPVTLKISGGA